MPTTNTENRPTKSGGPTFSSGDRVRAFRARKRSLGGPTMKEAVEYLHDLVAEGASLGDLAFTRVLGDTPCSTLAKVITQLEQRRNAIGRSNLCETRDEQGTF